MEIIFNNEADGEPISWGFDYTHTKSINIQQDGNDSKADWLKLDNHKCANCTLAQGDYPTCPAARALNSYAKNIINKKSIDKATVKVWESSGRYIEFKDRPLQDITGELVRIAVFQSACPVGRQARKIIDFIPPFPTKEEVIHAFTLFFAVQKLQNENRDDKKDADYLNILNDLFTNLSHRVQDFAKGDAGINGVLIYHSLTVLMSLSITKQLEHKLKSFD
ncbi:hypothetical protein PQO03_20715 [Lentisphaera profundi]|uniref:Uncharacterized protein n=1 Tax=Lentisphaera profundi TaxID=1658616 RepID=A0ABY7VWZ3_9BACT|nr:hypothetical protein [Lentisphaera profundi]WDE98242.1 hypothetical protein PQO03_20715 [Lentisphaera profundi]